MGESLIRINPPVTTTSIGAVAKGDLGLNVKDYGAKGDGTTDDTTAFHSARDAAGVGGRIHVPSGTYAVNVSLSINKQTWLLAPGAVLVPATTTGSVVTVASNYLTLEGGTLQGTWNYGSAQNTDTDNKITTQVLLNCTPASGTTYTGLTVKSVTFTLAGLEGMRLFGSSGGSITNVTVKDCLFYRNRYACRIENGPSTGTHGTMKDLHFDNTVFDTSWIPASTANALVGANLLGIAYKATNVNITNCIFRNSGRFDIEIFASLDECNLGQASINVNIDNCVLEPAVYRDITLCAINSSVTNCTITDTASFIEPLGRGLTFANNHFNGTFIQSNSSSSSAISGTAGQAEYSNNFWTIVGNYFENLTQRSMAIYALRAQNWLIANNTIVDGGERVTGFGTALAPLTVVSSSDMIIEANQVTQKAATTGPIVRVSGNQRVAVKNNSLRVVGTGTWTNTNIVMFEDNANSVLSGNSLYLAPTYTNAVNGIVSTSTGVTTLTHRQWTGSAWSDSSILGVLSTPPVSPATNDTYVVGTVSTGLWASNPGQLATWNGSAWTFTVINKHVWLNVDNPYVTDTTPANGTSTPHLVLWNGGLSLSNFFYNNNWDTNAVLSSGIPRYDLRPGSTNGASLSNTYTETTASYQSRLLLYSDLPSLPGVLTTDGDGGTTLPNAASLKIKDTGGTARNVVNLSSGNNVLLGDTSGALTGSSTLVLAGSGGTIRLRVNGNDQLLAAAGALTVVDATNVGVGTTTGTKLGTSTTQKLGFWNATPAVQPSVTGSSTGGQSALASLLTQLASIGLVANNSLTGITSKSSTYTALSTDTLVLCTAGSAGFALTLPAVAAGQELTVIKVDSAGGSISVSPATGTINGATSDSVSFQYQPVTYVSDGTNWYTKRGEGPLQAIATFSPSIPSTHTFSVATANKAWFTKVRVHATRTVTQLATVPGAASGNIDLGIYAADGTSGAPGTRLASTGSTACPTAGAIAWTNLTASVTLTPGDYWLALAADNTTATFKGTDPGLFLGLNVSTTASFPLPSTSPSSSAATRFYPVYAAIG